MSGGTDSGNFIDYGNNSDTIMQHDPVHICNHVLISAWGNCFKQRCSLECINSQGFPIRHLCCEGGGVSSLNSRVLEKLCDEQRAFLFEMHTFLSNLMTVSYGSFRMTI